MHSRRHVMTDKATVEIPPPVDGEVICLTGKLGDIATFGAGVSACACRYPENRCALLGDMH